jgi:hypothetical protein
MSPKNQMKKVLIGRPLSVCSFLRLQPELDQAADGFGAGNIVCSCPCIEARNRLRLKARGDRLAEFRAGRPPHPLFVYSFVLLGHEYLCTRKASRGEAVNFRPGSNPSHNGDESNGQG